MILVIDNYDSFTYTIVHYINELGYLTKVVYNDQIEIEEINLLNPQCILISPGPCTPRQAGISVKVIQQFAGIYPILGVCLGHQSIAYAFGGEIIHAKQLMHGKTSAIYHNESGLFKGLPSPFTATRYHSLVVNPAKLPKEFEVSAWTLDAQHQTEEIMGIKHVRWPLEGIQFHPESILTEYGHTMLKNFLSNNTRSNN